MSTASASRPCREHVVEASVWEQACGGQRVVSCERDAKSAIPGDFPGVVEDQTALPGRPPRKDADLVTVRWRIEITAEDGDRSAVDRCRHYVEHLLHLMEAAGARA
jgi:hypothetical protein